MRSRRRDDRRHAEAPQPRSSVQLSWTRLGRSIGATDSWRSRREIRAAAEQMTWADARDVAWLQEAPTRSVARAIFFDRRDQLQRAGIAPIGGEGVRLIGLEDATGCRYFLLHDPYRAEVLYALLITPVRQVAA